MSEQIDRYLKQAAAVLTDIPWLAALKKKAQADFARLGFPSRHNEEWKYTAIDSFLAHDFTEAKANKAIASRDNDLPIELKIDVINGSIVGLEQAVQSLPDGVIVMPIKQAVIDHHDKIKPYLGGALSHEHGFQALNTALMNSGLFIYLPKDVHVKQPILLAHWQDGNNQAVYVRHLIVAEAGSSLCLVEDYQGLEGCCYFTNTVTEIHAAANAHIQHYKIQRESKEAYHIGHLSALQLAGSQVDSHSFSIGGKLVRSDLTMHLNAPHARTWMNRAMRSRAASNFCVARTLKVCTLRCTFALS